MSTRSLAFSLTSLSSANQEGTFNTKTIKGTTSSSSAPSSTSHDPNGNYLGLLGWMVGWLVVGSNDAAVTATSAFTLSDESKVGNLVI